MKDICGRREVVYPASAIHQAEKFGEHWRALKSLSGSEDDEF